MSAIDKAIKDYYLEKINYLLEQTDDVPLLDLVFQLLQENA